ncbi:MAG: HEAT repeat domain-containing protein [Candidatus Latescibacter sp.]|nr:HEAT repeat domain-containing protein [Candidatus Latescibacter sp.]
MSIKILQRSIMKSKYIFKIQVFTLFIIFCGSLSKAFSQNSSNLKITESDLKVLENGDLNSAARVLYRMRQIYKNEGNKQIIQAIPALIKRANNDLSFMEKEKGIFDGEGELLGDVIWALSVTGDERVEPVLLDVMLSDKVFSSNTSKGFLNIGHSALKKILEALKSVNVNKKRSVALTLAQMSEFDTAGTYFTENDKKIIQEEMLKLIKEENELTRNAAVRALGYFGDKSTIPILTRIIHKIFTH